MFNLDFSVHTLWGEPREDSLYVQCMTDRQQRFDQKNVKIENAVETKKPTSWMPLR